MKNFAKFFFIYVGINLASFFAYSQTLKPFFVSIGNPIHKGNAAYRVGLDKLEKLDSGQYQHTLFSDWEGLRPNQSYLFVSWIRIEGKTIEDKRDIKVKNFEFSTETGFSTLEQKYNFVLPKEESPHAITFYWEVISNPMESKNSQLTERYGPSGRQILPQQNFQPFLTFKD